MDMCAQDIHFSQFYFSPMTASPAQTGFFNGNYRLASNYRNQWKLASGGFPFITYSASADAHALESIQLHSDILGIGASVYSDKAGTIALGSTAAYAAMAFHKDLTNNGKNFISNGIQIGWVQMGFDRNKMRLGDEIESDIPAGSGSDIFESTSIGYFDINAGTMYNMILNEKFQTYISLSAFHISRPKFNFFANAVPNRISIRTSVQWGAGISLSKKWSVLPAALYMWQGASSELNLGGAVKYLTPYGSNIRLGAWYRQWSNSDAVIFMTGFDYANFTIGFSYDVNVSSLTQTSHGKGAYEVALIYIIKKRAARDIRCPHF